MKKETQEKLRNVAANVIVICFLLGIFAFIITPFVLMYYKTEVEMEKINEKRNEVRGKVVDIHVLESYGSETVIFDFPDGKILRLNSNRDMALDIVKEHWYSICWDGYQRITSIKTIQPEEITKLK